MLHPLLGCSPDTSSSSTGGSSSSTASLATSLRVQLGPVSGLSAELLSDALLGLGAQSVVVEEGRSEGQQEQERFGAEAELWDSCKLLVHFAVEVRAKDGRAGTEGNQRERGIQPGGCHSSHRCHLTGLATNILGINCIVGANNVVYAHLHPATCEMSERYCVAHLRTLRHMLPPLVLHCTSAALQHDVDASMQMVQDICDLPDLPYT